ncbi:MAG: tRNA (N6-isopentenyl adenosine(37)-C2)-methylthiotransferase MiaB [Coriobacteriaceae bacterium]|nr:tRNA (N6-isopentenyl adenosine(37)-C2)-methylthiotransferase MiaB [Coriobacteriaceae bacterium]
MENTNLLGGMTYCLKIFGCQMNENDGERVAGMLDAQGCMMVDTIEAADIVVFITCCVREAADIRLMGQVASLKNIPPAHEGQPRLVCVGGCIGQRDGEKLRESLSHVDIVFGTHNLGHLVQLLEQRLETGAPVVETIEANDGFSSDLPATRARSWSAWVPIMTGCNNFCTYCIVPYVRGREESRPLEDIRAELAELAEQGVMEVTLLGQNVNSYGRDLYGEPRFAEVLHSAAQSGIPRIRFVTSHPKDLLPETIEAMAAHPSIMPQLHLPLQSGSDRILKAMNRVYDTARYRQLVADLRAAIPNISLSTDIIVGFPGETEEDFQATYELVREVGYGQVFTFIYSKREGTPAAKMEDDTPRELIQERFDRLVELVQASAYEQNQKELGQLVPVLVEGASKRDERMLSGKSPKNQTVHAPLPEGVELGELVGTIVNVRIEEAKTWYLRGSLVR